jgi:hypothetical protein
MDVNLKLSEDEPVSPKHVMLNQVLGWMESFCVLQMKIQSYFFKYIYNI